MRNDATQFSCAILGATVFCVFLERASFVGALVGLLCGLMFARATRSINSPEMSPFIRFRLLGYYARLLCDMIVSTLRLMHSILRKDFPASAIVHLTPHVTERGRVLVSNSITLTPGTVTLDETSEEYIVLYMDQPRNPAAYLSIAADFEKRLHDKEAQT